MSNRKQRRAAMKNGKRPGENYANVLARKKLIKETVERTVNDKATKIEGDIKGQRVIWMSVIAMQRAHGHAAIRNQRYLSELEKVAIEFEDDAKKNGAEVAVAHLMEQAGKAAGMQFTPVWEDEMRQARLENQANGVFFEADDPDKL